MFKGHPHLDTDHALILIDRLKGHVEEMVFGGGDPLLRKDLPTLINRAFDNDLRVEVQTNAQILTSEFVKNVKERVIRWGFSLDSCDPRVHDAIRGRLGNYKKVTEIAARLTAAGINWNLRTLVARPTLTTVEPIGEWLQSIQFRGNWYLLQYAAVGDEMHNRQHFEISDSEFRTTVEPIAKKYSQSSFRTISVPDGDRRQIYFLIAPDGDVYNHPLPGHPYVVVGNILSNTFDDLLKKLNINFQAHYMRYGVPETLRVAAHGSPTDIRANSSVGAHPERLGAKETHSIFDTGPLEPGT